MQSGRHINGWYCMRLMGHPLSSLRTCVYSVAMADVEQNVNGRKKINRNNIDDIVIFALAHLVLEAELH